MEKTVIFRDRQEFQAADPNALQTYARDSIDHVVADGISAQKHYTGFGVSAVSATEVEVQPGRFYSGGAVYVAEQPVAINLFQYIPLVTKKIVAIVLWGQEVDTSVEPRDFLVDLQTGATEPQAVAMQRIRKCEVNPLSGQESADPQPPVIQTGTLAVAHVYLTPAGIERIEMQTQSLLPNGYDQEQRLDGIEAWKAAAEPRIASIATDLAALAKKSSDKADRAMFVEIAQDLASVKERLQLPSSYSSYQSDAFADTAKSNAGHVGFAARIDHGLLFPFAASIQANLALFNPIDAGVSVSGQNVVLPAYTHAARIQTQGYAGDLSISQYQVQTHTVREQKIVSWEKKYGWHGNFLTRWYARNVWAKLGTKYQWTLPWHGYFEQHETTQYVDEVTTTGYNGAMVAQSFLVANALWLTRLGLFFTQIGPSGDVQVIVCETDGGKPNLEKTVASIALPRASLKAYPAETVIDVPHVLLEGGKRYAIVLITQGDHRVATVSGNAYTQGTLFYGSDGDYFVGDLTRDLMFTVYGAKFARVRTEVQLQSVSLSGGLTDLAIAAQHVVPEGTELRYEIQPSGSGAWYPLGDPSLVLSTSPNLVNLRAVLLGTSDLAPAFVLTNNAIQASRPDTSFVHWSAARAVASTTSVTLKLLVAHWDAANHTLTPRIVTGGSNEVAPSTTVITDEDGAKRFSYTFTIPASTAYEIKLSGTRNAASQPFAVVERIDVAA
ncbi:hypothetical protein ACSHWI_14315 [Methylococcus sp. S2T]|uniref:hypothetical protein n=1 Tax=Methylococcus sp. S2T TaxID=3438967 RepID=UPI003ED91D8B